MSCRKNFGPGPGAYNLPTTFGYKNCDARMERSPGFSFGKRNRSCNNPNRRRAAGPGPADYFPDKVSRFGRVTEHEFSVFSPHSSHWVSRR
ncbi:protein CIMAP1D [Drosophila bipectinata]|uniref:protein CIMAP1D n=1 Tax=Drosophila bipectinata TaxID=42026 RepID=UPI001C8AAA1B|nr:outer dense fiber protein 3B [Drosophila bipectinata]